MDNSETARTRWLVTYTYTRSGYTSEAIVRATDEAGATKQVRQMMRGVSIVEAVRA